MAIYESRRRITDVFLGGAELTAAIANGGSATAQREQAQLNMWRYESLRVSVAGEADIQFIEAASSLISALSLPRDCRLKPLTLALSPMGRGATYSR